MVRYHKFMLDIDANGNCIDFYSTGAALLTFIASGMSARFNAFRVESG